MSYPFCAVSVFKLIHWVFSPFVILFFSPDSSQLVKKQDLQHKTRSISLTLSSNSYYFFFVNLASNLFHGLEMTIFVANAEKATGGWERKKKARLLVDL